MRVRVDGNCLFFISGIILDVWSVLYFFFHALYIRICLSEQGLSKYIVARNEGNYE